MENHDLSDETVQDRIYIMITRYVTGAALVVLLYDHLLTLGSEVKLIWPVKMSAPKFLFLFMRYTVPIALIIFTIQLSGLEQELELSAAVIVSIRQPSGSLVSHLRSCVSWMSVATFLATSTIATSNFLILLRLWVVWDRNRRLVIWTLLLFVLAQFGGLAAASVLVSEFKQKLVWNKTLHMCGFDTKPPPIAILWAPGTVFEVVLCVITWWNVLTQPRTSNASLASAIYRDGLMYFLILLCLRIINTILAVRAPSLLIFVAVLPVWCATTTTTCRLMIKLRQIDHNRDRIGPHDLSAESIAIHDEYDELVQSGVHIEMLRSVGPSTPIGTSIRAPGSHGHLK
ncbi:hypothetical protein K438DRAFT_165307 [Mycena galopus ATCC 62051]|nr:hypothetical protein K438DRAFT_165307 [Mycena galopus ATCC 62051]